jgi:hypothetical protein
MTRCLLRPRYPLPAEPAVPATKGSGEEFAKRLPKLNRIGAIDYDKRGRRIVP